MFEGGEKEYIVSAFKSLNYNFLPVTAVDFHVFSDCPHIREVVSNYYSVSVPQTEYRLGTNRNRTCLL